MTEKQEIGGSCMIEKVIDILKGCMEKDVAEITEDMELVADLV